jgi:hypothetical protein
MEQGDGKGDEIDQGLLLAPFFITSGNSCLQGTARH